MIRLPRKAGTTDGGSALWRYRRWFSGPQEHQVPRNLPSHQSAKQPQRARGGQGPIGTPTRALDPISSDSVVLRLAIGRARWQWNAIHARKKRGALSFSLDLQGEARP